MNRNQKLIARTANHVKAQFSGEGTGHDWHHIERVWKLARHIGEIEKADLVIVELGALLHDIADFKFHGGDETAGPKAARTWLESLKMDPDTIDAVCHIVEHVSFKGSAERNKMKTLEGKVVQDADRLDALGAIGIARAFAYGGSKHRPLYEPGQEAQTDVTFEDYKKGAASTVHHFYEKLLLLKELMNTQTGRQMAEARHRYMEDFLKRFYQEWNGEA